jgi:hypothetical protein
VSCSATLEVVGQLLSADEVHQMSSCVCFPEGEGERRGRTQVACKPSFLVEAHNAFAQEGQRAVLEAAATGSPMPTFKW